MARAELFLSARPRSCGFTDVVGNKRHENRKQIAFAVRYPRSFRRASSGVALAPKVSRACMRDGLGALGWAQSPARWNQATKLPGEHAGVVYVTAPTGMRR